MRWNTNYVVFIPEFNCKRVSKWLFLCLWCFSCCPSLHLATSAPSLFSPGSVAHLSKRQPTLPWQLQATLSSPACVCVCVVVNLCEPVCVFACRCWFCLSAPSVSNRWGKICSIGFINFLGMWLCACLCVHVFAYFFIFLPPPFISESSLRLRRCTCACMSVFCCALWQICYR